MVVENLLVDSAGSPNQVLPEAVAQPFCCGPVLVFEIIATLMIEAIPKYLY